MTERESSLAMQQELYGMTLDEAFATIASTISVSRATIARVLGVSAPMLSQLASGQRTKIGNPLAVQRLNALLSLVAEVNQGLPHERIASRLEEISSDRSGTLTRSGTAGGHAQAVQDLLRAVASGRELLQAADLLQQRHPDLADLLRVYGTGTSAEAEAHFNSLGELLRGTLPRP